MDFRPPTADSKLTGHGPLQAHQSVRDMRELFEATENFVFAADDSMWNRKETIATLDTTFLRGRRATLAAAGRGGVRSETGSEASSSNVVWRLPSRTRLEATWFATL